VSFGRVIFAEKAGRHKHGLVAQVKSGGILASGVAKGAAITPDSAIWSGVRVPGAKRSLPALSTCDLRVSHPLSDGGRGTDRVSQ
jgi:hypothetical protein